MLRNWLINVLIVSLGSYNMLIHIIISYRNQILDDRYNNSMIICYQNSVFVYYNILYFCFNNNLLFCPLSLVTTPSEPSIVSIPDVSLYFSGVAIIFRCIFTIDSPINDDPNAVVTAEWRKGGNVLSGDLRLTVITPALLGGMSYLGSLNFDYLTQLDSDNYSCVVFVTSNVNSDFITNSSVSSSIMINVEG